jgi:dihydroorotase
MVTVVHRVHIYTEKKIHEGYVVIDQGKIIRIGTGSVNPDIERQATQIIDGKDTLLLPGCIDMHVHFRDMNQAAKETITTGSQAALAGGVTTVLAMPNTNPPLSTLSAIDTYLTSSRELYCNIGIYANVTDGFRLADLTEMRSRGIFGLKIYPGGKSTDVPLEWMDFWKTRGNPDRISSEFENLFLQFPTETPWWEQLLHAAKNIGLPLLFHPELAYTPEEYKVRFDQAQEEDRKIPTIRNPLLTAHCAAHSIANNELAHVEMVCAFLRHFFPNPSDSPRVHFCHLTSALVLSFIRTVMQKAGYRVTGEVTPHHMLLNHQMSFPHEHYAKVLTPLRSPMEQQKLWEKVQEGKFDLIATDHAPHTHAEKTGSFDSAPSGFPGVDVALRLLLTRVFDFQLAMDKVVEGYSTRPAEFLGLTTKGRIAPGYDADLVFIERTAPTPISAKESYSLAKWSPYEGMKVKAKIAKVMLGGELVFDPDHGLMLPKGKILRKTQ